MPYRTILTYLDDGDDSGLRLEAACDLGERFGAHVSALGLAMQVFGYHAAGADGFDSSFDVEEFEATCQRAAEIANDAKEMLAKRGIGGDARWASHEAIGLTDTAGRQARRADLAIAGQPVDGVNLALREAVLDGALFRSGRPVLILPALWAGGSVGKKVVVAWDGSQQASRAINDALPFIESADRTVVVIVDPDVGTQRFGEEPGADITAALARHCKSTMLDRIPSFGKSISESLLRYASDADSDLIVMGGYGHSQLRESIFGGVSREMIHNSGLPLLLSH